MPDRPDILEQPGYDFAADRLELSRLVGYDLILFSDQFPGKELRTKALAAADRQIHIEAGKRFGDMENLVNNQRLVVQFVYRGQEISVRATFQRTIGGRCLLKLGDKVTPLSHRRFCRIPLATLVRLAAYPVAGFAAKKLNQLRWIETSSLNFSSGGLMVILPSPFERGTNLLMNVNPENIEFPTLVMGRVCHCFQAEDLQYRVGIEFLTGETVRKTIPPARMRGLPAALLDFDNAVRENVNKIVLRRAKTGHGVSDTGVIDEG
jgi:hypothetical protein